MSGAEHDDTVDNVVLVHGAFVDGSGWRAVHDELTKAGFRVTIVQIATASLADDVATTKRAIAALDGPVVLVGHSYGGVVITEAGTAPNVAALVYVAAFAPDTGESVSTLASNPAPGASGPPILPPQGGALFLDRAKFQEAFAADWATSWRRSWPIRRRRGGWRRSGAPSPSRRGSRGPAGTSSPRKTA